MTSRWNHLDHLAKPIPILQWVVVLVLSAHVLLSAQGTISTEQAIRFVSLMLVVNVIGLYILPDLIGTAAAATVLVLLDTLLAPAMLSRVGALGTDLFVVYVGISMIAGAAGSLVRALTLAAVICVAYGTFALFGAHPTSSLGTVLLRLPFFLLVTFLHGFMKERAERDKKRLAYAAVHDGLTGMPNRRSILNALSRALEEAKRFKSPLSCAMMDIDGFKRVNDMYGHAVGDQTLREYAALLVEQQRGYDLIGRVGGEEYAWILPRMDAEGAIAAGERLRQTVERQRFKSGDRLFRLTTSIGMTTYEPGQTSHPTPATMLEVADQALYQAKRQGPNQVHHMPLPGRASDGTLRLQPTTGGGAEAPRPPSP